MKVIKYFGFSLFFLLTLSAHSSSNAKRTNQNSSWFAKITGKLDKRHSKHNSDYSRDISNNTIEINKEFRRLTNYKVTPKALPLFEESFQRIKSLYKKNFEICVERGDRDWEIVQANNKTVFNEAKKHHKRSLKIIFLGLVIEEIINQDLYKEEKFLLNSDLDEAHLISEFPKKNQNIFSKILFGEQDKEEVYYTDWIDLKSTDLTDITEFDWEVVRPTINLEKKEVVDALQEKTKHNKAILEQLFSYLLKDLYQCKIKGTGYETNEKQERFPTLTRDFDLAKMPEEAPAVWLLLSKLLSKVKNQNRNRADYFKQIEETNPVLGSLLSK